MSNDIRMGYCP